MSNIQQSKRFRRKYKPKKKALIAHSYKRCLERHDIELTCTLRDEIKKQICNGVARFIEKQSNRVSKFEVFIEEKFLTILWDKKRKVIITALP